MIRHLRREEARQEIALLTLQTEKAEEQRAPLSDRVEERQAAFDKARMDLNGARGELSELIYGRLSDLRRGISDAENRLTSLDNEPTTEETAPPVRSVWQLREQKAQTAEQENVVIPQSLQEQGFEAG